MAIIQNLEAFVQSYPAGLDSVTDLQLSQNENGRQIRFTIGGVTIPAGSVATISGTKPDGVVYSNTGTIEGADTVIFDEDVQMTAVFGTWYAKIRITNAGNTIASARVRFIIDKDPVDAGAIPSESQLDGLVAEAEEYAEAAEDAAGRAAITYGSPLTASTAAAMTDVNRVYVYTGSESGYTYGNWYYYNGSAWVSGGIYNSAAVETDTTLTESGVPADAKATGDKIAELKDDLTNVNSIKIVRDKTDDFINDFGITTSGDIGSAVSIAPVQNTGYRFLIIKCKAGDIFELTGTGASSFRLWAFIDTNFNLLKSANSYADGSFILTAEKDGFFIANCSKASPYSLTSVQFVDQEELTNIVDELSEKNRIGRTRRITNPHDLVWKMGAFGQSGPQGGTFTDRMYATCRVKAGSVISAPASGGVNISFGYKLDDSATTLDYYRTFGYSSYEITQDCTIFIGVLYNTPTYLLNDSLLDAITIDLIVDDFVSKYSKHNDIAYGNPVAIYCEGQHIDTTGWTNATVDINAVHGAFDTLMTESNGYIDKVDLGEAYDGYHMYQYTTKPVGLHVTDFKVPKIAIICCQHGNEKMSAYAMHYLLYDLIHNASKNPVLSYLRSNCAISFIPIANPWGFINTSRLNEGGVNLNRNWPTYNWDSYADSTSDFGGINYKGSYPASAPQTKLMMNFLRNNQDAIFAIDLHTNGTDTEAWYEISSTILCETQDKNSIDYNIQHSYVESAKVFTNHIKAWLDEKYGTDLGNVFYGSVTLEPDRPTASQWTRESNNMVGITYEVFCGSSTNYLGNKLTKYSSDSIKASAENLANFLVAMIINTKKH